jgi:hypothetical protein
VYASPLIGGWLADKLGTSGRSRSAASSSWPGTCSYPSAPSVVRGAHLLVIEWVFAQMSAMVEIYREPPETGPTTSFTGINIRRFGPVIAELCTTPSAFTPLAVAAVGIAISVGIWRFRRHHNATGRQACRNRRRHAPAHRRRPTASGSGPHRHLPDRHRVLDGLPQSGSCMTYVQREHQLQVGDHLQRHQSGWVIS